jgi:hypothetical protein
MKIWGIKKSGEEGGIQLTPGPIKDTLTATTAGVTIGITFFMTAWHEESKGARQPCKRTRRITLRSL